MSDFDDDVELSIAEAAAGMRLSIVANIYLCAACGVATHRICHVLPGHELSSERSHCPPEWLVRSAEPHEVWFCPGCAKTPDESRVVAALRNPSIRFLP